MNLGWPGLDRREAAVVRLHADFRGFAQSGSNPGHPFFFDRLKKAKALPHVEVAWMVSSGREYRWMAWQRSVATAVRPLTRDELETRYNRHDRKGR